MCVDASREFREVGVEHDSGAEDPYAWLEDQRTDAVRALVERENELALQALEETQGFQVRIVYRDLRCGLCSRCECVAVGLRTGGVQDALVKEMKARLSAQSEDQLPHTVRGYEYFERTPVDKEHSILCRRVAGSSGGDAEVQELLDVNQLAAGTGFAEVALDLYSHDGTAMAYMVRLLRRCGWVGECVGLLKLVGASGGHYWHGSSRSLRQGPAVWCYTPCRTSRGRCRVRGCRHALGHTVRVVLCVCGCVRVCSHVLPPGT